MRSIRSLLAVAAVAAALAPGVASAQDNADPLCRLHTDKPTVTYDENGVPESVTVTRPYWVC